MYGLIMFAAGLMSVPLPNVTHAERLQRAYPREAIRAGKSAAALIRVVVNPSGEVERCETLEIYGDEDLGKHPCSVYGRWKFDRPVGADGQPSFGVYETFVTYTLSEWLGEAERQADEIARMVQRPDVTFTVQSLPKDVGSVMDLQLVAQVTMAGEVTHCEGVEEVSAAYTNVACGALKDAGWDVLRNEQGAAVPYVAALKVRFTTEAIG